MQEKVNISNQTSRYYLIDYIKLVMSFIVLFYHYNYFQEKWSNPYLFRGGYICVDVFFIIGGFFFARSLENKSDIKFSKFILHKIKTLYPLYLISFVFTLVINIWIIGFDIFMTKDYILASLEELFLIQEWGIYVLPALTYNNAAAWYISAMFFVFIVFFFIFKYGKKVKYFILFAISLLLTIFLYKHSGHMHVHAFINEHISLGIIRAIIGMGFGCIAYKVSSEIKLKVRLVYIILISFAGLYVMLMTKNSFMDFLIIPISFLGIILFYKYEEQKDKKIRNDKFVTKYISKYVGTLSYVIYLNHLTVKNILNYLQIEYSSVAFFAISVSISILILMIYELMKRSITPKRQ